MTLRTHTIKKKKDNHTQTWEWEETPELLAALEKLEESSQRVKDIKVPKFKNKLLIDENNSKNAIPNKNPEINKMLDDLKLTLQSLNYKNKEIKAILPNLIKETDFITKKEKTISFENLLKLAMNYLDKDSSNIVR